MPSDRGAHGRWHAATAGHRPAREAAGPRHHHRGTHPSAQQPGGGHGTRGFRPPRGRRPHAAQARNGGRGEVHPRGPAGPGEHPGRGRRAGGEVPRLRADRTGDVRSRRPDRRLAGRPRDRGRLGLRADVRRRGPRHRLARAGLSGGRRGRRHGFVAECDRMAEVHDRQRTADERDRRGQQAHLRAARRRKAVFTDGPRLPTAAPTSTSCCEARS